MPYKVADKLLSWGTDVDGKALSQAAMAATMPFIEGHIALMPDAHVGMGATIGSVIPTSGAIIPSAVGVDIGCVDMDTEFLSRYGWKKISDWDGDSVAQFDLWNHRVTFADNARYVKRESQGFFHLKTKYGIDQMVSRDHRMPVWTPHGRNRTWVEETITASEFVERHDGYVNGIKSRFLTAPASFENESGLYLASYDELRVQVMVNADGHETKSGAAVVKLRKQRKIDRARKLLANAGIDHTENEQGNGDVVFRFTPPFQKNDWGILWGCSSSELAEIADEAFHWDGNAKDGVFYTRDEDAADFIQYAFFSMGWRAVKRVDERDGRNDYRVYAHANTLVGIESSPSRNEIPFVGSVDGFEYCFQVPTSYWVMRRNGQIAITGNCGMIAVETTMKSGDLPVNLNPLLSRIEQAVPAGVGQGHEHAKHGDAWILEHPNFRVADNKLKGRAAAQFGSLGSGNHFVEICLDPSDNVWVVLHSGSRGVGNKLAMMHITDAKSLMKEYFIKLPDPDLAYFVEGTQAFQNYMTDLMWAQEYALANRERMMDAVLDAVAEVTVGAQVDEKRRINCHHNYTAKEHHMGKNLWITRKGAIRARVGDWGVIPGSMGTSSFIVEGLGNKASFDSSAHGAGRRMSRSQAKRELSTETLAELMDGKAWLSDKGDALLDEHPDSYKDIFQVMRDQADLVRVDTELTQILNYKGAK